MDKRLEEFQLKCREYLDTFALYELRPYGRKIGVEEPTKKQKDDLIDEIINVLIGAKQPVPQSNRGAPVKSNFFNPEISKTIENIRLQVFGEENKTTDLSYDADLERMKAFKKEKPMELVFCSPTFLGQLVKADGMYWLVPLSCDINGEKILIADEFVQSYGLRLGDAVDCFADRREKFLVATNVKKINGVPVKEFKRIAFEDADACYPYEKLDLYAEKVENPLVGKYFDWLLPIYRGQRGYVSSLPKSGKSRLLYAMAQNAQSCNPDVKTLVLLVGQPPEIISDYRKTFHKEDLLYTTYENEPEWQVFTADFFLNKAKRLAESGKDVVLFVDGLNELARAYNDTKESSGGKVLAGGLESKTVQYLKKYLGSARKLEKGGSLTIIGTLSYGTGSPADDVLYAEINAVSNLQIRLNENLTQKRKYYAVDLLQSFSNGVETDEKKQRIQSFVRQKYIPENGAEKLHERLFVIQNFDEI